ncbi:hypothetical protein A4X03_0g7063 [Tilletia caries]|uniref:Asparagine synthetase domain-containing protein n=1 Tax=Tilletia caries TaxID=13290 RepID=A0A8T8SS82_9BASI|nr:hypothetical protein A4X03_0g7063 [Tilletia caries]
MRSGSSRSSFTPTATSFYSHRSRRRSHGSVRGLFDPICSGPTTISSMAIMTARSAHSSKAFTICFPDRCIAEAPLTDDLINALKKGGKLTLTSVNYQNKQFLQNIRLHLRSDVPLGAALSGGVDSSAVVCAIRHVEPKIDIHTFSFVADNEALSEEKWIDLVNEAVGAKSYKVRAGASDLARDLDRLIETQGEPFGSTSIYAQYLVFQRAKAEGITVTLDGQGADELLAGYDGYPGQRMLSLLEGRNVTAMHRFARASAQWPGRSYRRTWLELGRVVLPDWAYARSRKVMGH